VLPRSCEQDQNGANSIALEAPARGAERGCRGPAQAARGGGTAGLRTLLWNRPGGPHSGPDGKEISRPPDDLLYAQTELASAEGPPGCCAQSRPCRGTGANRIQRRCDAPAVRSGRSAVPCNARPPWHEPPGSRRSLGADTARVVGATEAEVSAATARDSPWKGCRHASERGTTPRAVAGMAGASSTLRAMPGRCRPGGRAQTGSPPCSVVTRRPEPGCKPAAGRDRWPRPSRSRSRAGRWGATPTAGTVPMGDARAHVRSGHPDADVYHRRGRR
jgi:hypothetical protein